MLVLIQVVKTPISNVGGLGDIDVAYGNDIYSFYFISPTTIDPFESMHDWFNEHMKKIASEFGPDDTQACFLFREEQHSSHGTFEDPPEEWTTLDFVCKADLSKIELLMPDIQG